MSLTRDPRFPASFVWGAATASFQIEGATNEGGRGESIWDRFCATPGKVLNGDDGSVAIDFYHRYLDDIRLMQDLGIESFRFSVAWPRVIPGGVGAVSEDGLDFYDRLVDALLDAGIAPCVTLYHWDLPIALEDAGGWPDRGIIEPFVDYTAAVAGRLGDRVKRWITHNEPWVVGWMGYGTGEHAPGRKSRRDALAASHHVLVSHGRAVDVLRELVPEAEVGITLNLHEIVAASDSPADVAAARYVDGYHNRWYLDPIYRGSYPEDMLEIYGADVPDVHHGDFELTTRPTDFLGINFYTRHVIAAGTTITEPRHVLDGFAPRTDMNWEVYPQALRNLLVRLHAEYAPPAMHITENGAAYTDVQRHDGSVPDPDRVAYIEGHVEAMAQAIAEGVPLTAYYVWSLLDNFEWAWGYARRFGIVYVDYTTLERTPKASFEYYRQLIAAQRVSGAGEGS
jgi:beta-glucosidase